MTKMPEYTVDRKASVLNEQESVDQGSRYRSCVQEQHRRLQCYRYSQERRRSYNFYDPWIPSIREMESGMRGISEINAEIIQGI